MLQCKYCDYLKKMDASGDRNSETYICEFTKFTFDCDIEHITMDHPCHCLQHAIFA